MSNNTTVESVLDQVEAAYARMAAAMPQFHERATQREMSEAIVQTWMGEAGRPLIAVEGQTGTGKTLAYLLAAIPVAQALDKKLVLATATTALQGQLVEHEIPAVERHSGFDFTTLVAKGRGRYVDPNRLNQLLGRDPNQASMFDDDTPEAMWTHEPSEREIAQLKDMAQRLEAREWDGCCDSLEYEVDSRTWGLVASTPYTCSSMSQCQPMGLCPFHKARVAMKDANVIVANHDLVLSDLFLGGGLVLPEPESALYVLDEGHHLPEKAVEHASAEGNLRSIIDNVTQFARVAPQLPDPVQPAADLQHITQQLSQDARELRTVLGALDYQRCYDETVLYRAPGGDCPEAVREAALKVKEPLAEATQSVAGVVKAIDDADITEPTRKAQLDQLAPQIGAIKDRLMNAVRLFELIGEQPEAHQAPIARWFEHRSQDYHLAAAPVAAGPMLKRCLWDRCAGALVTSATLTALNRWGRFRTKAGLERDDGTEFLQIKSPFDYASAAELVVPTMASDGGQARAHTDELAERIPKLLDENRVATLVLFASWKQLRAVRDALAKPMRARVRCQGDASRDTLLARHRAAVDQGEAAVLFGLASFAEGVDLRGRECDHVVIAKLPFKPPDSPIEATRAEWLEKHGKSPFLLMAVPEASLKLSQAAGRLMRAETDSGRITLLDRRIVTKRYGKSLLDALPPFRRVIESGQRAQARATTLA
jgi:ATP-dependent DNA helicase DinG